MRRTDIQFPRDLQRRTKLKFPSRCLERLTSALLGAGYEGGWPTCSRCSRVTSMTLTLSGQDRESMVLRSRCHMLLNSNPLCPQESVLSQSPTLTPILGKVFLALFRLFSCCPCSRAQARFQHFFISAQLFPWALFAFLYISAVCAVEISLKSLLLLPWWLSGKESACQCRRHRRRGFDPWVWKIPWRKAWQPFLPRKSHGQRRLVGYSLWGHQESGTTEHGENTHTPSHTYLPKVVCPPKSAFLEGELHIHTHTHTHTHTKLLLTLIFPT